MFNATEACMRNCSKVGVSWLIMKVTLSSWKQKSGTLFFNIHTKFYQNNGRGLPICRSLACKSSRCPRNQIETASKPQQAKKQVLIARYKKRKKNKTKQVELMFLFWIQAAQNYLPETYQFWESDAPVDYHQACEPQLSQHLLCPEVVLTVMMLAWMRDWTLAPTSIKHEGHHDKQWIKYPAKKNR